MTRSRPPQLMARLVTLAALAAVPIPAWSEVPPLDYFTGLYERVGRDDAGGLVNDLVRLDPKGKALVMTVCPDPIQSDPIELRFDTAFEAENFLSGQLGLAGLWCQFHNDGQNYAILTCATDAQARFTLWPLGSGAGCSPG